ncbi:MAG TPA: hypothetical protein PKY56_02105 [Candidatus Kapabacteria bacterium]|nr:hypothetical protein [Candidatus Kapabacteria bacterium]
MRFLAALGITEYIKLIVIGLVLVHFTKSSENKKAILGIIKWLYKFA